MGGSCEFAKKKGEDVQWVKKAPERALAPFDVRVLDASRFTGYE